MNTSDTSRRAFLRRSALMTGALPLTSLNLGALTGIMSAAQPGGAVAGLQHNTPQTLLADKRLRVSYSPERMVMPDGLQPSMLCTRKGTLIVQAQSSRKVPYDATKRMVYPSAMSTAVSRDGGDTWTGTGFATNANDVNIEGALHQLPDGTILALDTYVVPAKEPDTGSGMMYTSKDEYGTLEGPIEVKFQIPNADFYGSTDDNGRPHAAMRLHRRIIELPGGDLLCTMYGLLKGDHTPASYMKTMMKMRVMLFRSSDRGHMWNYVSTVAVDPSVGTEGFDEPVIALVSHGPNAGRLVCLMRTGQQLYEAFSSDQGKSWTDFKPRIFAGRDVFKTSEWADMFKDVKRNNVPISQNPTEFVGAVVDPDMIELKNGVLAATFGIRIPPRVAFAMPGHPWNGNYLAFSFDGGDSWSHVEQLTSGVPTTHYTALEQMKTKDDIFVVYDFGSWNNKVGRYVYGRKVSVKRLS